MKSEKFLRPEKYLNVSQFAERYGKSRPIVLKLIVMRVLPVIWIGKRLYIDCSKPSVVIKALHSLPGMVIIPVGPALTSRQNGKTPLMRNLICDLNNMKLKNLKNCKKKANCKRLVKQRSIKVSEGGIIYLPHPLPIIELTPNQLHVYV